MLNRDFKLRERVEQLEQTVEFSALVNAAKERFGGSHHRVPGPKHSDWGWKRAMSNFLKRSGFYQSAYAEKARVKVAIASRSGIRLIQIFPETDWKAMLTRIQMEQSGKPKSLE